MKFLKFCLLAAALPLLPTASKAEQVDWGALGNFIVNTQNGRLPAGTSQVTSGSTLLLVHFNSATTNFSLSYSALLAANAFTTYDTSFIGEGGLPAGEFFASTASTLPGTAGDLLYMWFFNSADPSAATQTAIIANPTWIRPQTGANTVSYDASDLGTFVPVGAPGTILNNSPSPLIQGDVRLSAIPEPSTYVLAIVGLGVAAGIARRRRQAVS